MEAELGARHLSKIPIEDAKRPLGRSIETGHEMFAGTQGFYGLGGCVMPRISYEHIKTKWRELRTIINGDPNAPAFSVRSITLQDGTTVGHIDERTGLDVLDAAKRKDPRCAVILMTGRGTVETVMAATKGGAFEYIAKPFEFTAVIDILPRKRVA